MAAYLVTHMKIKDPERYQAYTKLAAAAVDAAGGKMRGRGTLERIEGDWAEGRVLIIEFPTSDAARGFYESSAYKNAAQSRQGTVEFFDTALVPGVD